MNGSIRSHQLEGHGPSLEEVKEYMATKEEYLETEAGLFRQFDQSQFAQEFQRWKDGAFAQYMGSIDTAQNLLNLVESDVKVDAAQYWSRRMIAKHCSCALDERKLIRATDGVTVQDRALQPAWKDIIKLTATLNNFKTKGFVSEKQAANVDKLQLALQRSAFDASEIRRISEGLATKLGEEIEAHTIAADLTRHEEIIAGILPDIENLENMHEEALLSGDMLLAEELATKQIGLYESLIGVIREQYPIIRKRQEDAKEYRRRRRWAIFRMANRDVRSVIQHKKRQIEACDEDKAKILFQREHYAGDDAALRARFATDRSEGDRYLNENKAKQQACWTKMDDLIREMEAVQDELKELAARRVEEINRRIEMDEREQARLDGHSAFLQISQQYLDDLEATSDNARRCIEVCNDLNGFILDGCSTIASKFDRTESHLRELLFKVSRQYMKQHTEYYLACGRMKYRKDNKLKLLEGKFEEEDIKHEFAKDTLDLHAKKFSMQKVDLTKQMDSTRALCGILAEKMEKSSQDFEPIRRELVSLGLPCVDPSVMLHKSNIDRREKVVELRDLMNDTDKRIIAQIERDRAEVESEQYDVLAAKAQAEKAENYAKSYESHVHIASGPYDKMPPDPANPDALKIVQSHGLRPGPTSAPQRPVPPKEKSPGLSSPKQRLAVDNAGRMSQSSLLGTAPPTSQPGPPPPVAATATKHPPWLPTVNNSPRLNTQNTAASLEAAVPPAAEGGSPPTPPGDGALPANLEGRSVVALHPFTGRNPDELNFSSGERIIVMQKAEEGWWYGICNQKMGMFPATYVGLDPEDQG